MKRTTNYALPTWEKSDFIQMSDFNDLTHKLDAALKSHDDTLNTKADTSSVTAVQQEVAAAREANCLVKLAGPLVTTAADAAMEFRPLAGRHDEDRGAVFHILRGVIERQYGNFCQRYITGDGVQQQLEHDGGDFMAGANVRRCFFRVNAGAEQQQRDCRLRRLRSRSSGTRSTR